MRWDPATRSWIPPCGRCEEKIREQLAVPERSTHVYVRCDVCGTLICLIRSEEPEPLFEREPLGPNYVPKPWKPNWGEVQAREGGTR